MHKRLFHVKHISQFLVSLVNVNHNNYKLVSVQLFKSMYSTLINDNGDDDDYSVII